MKFALGQAVPRIRRSSPPYRSWPLCRRLVLPRLAHGYVLRSPHAHARIRSIGIRGAQQTPGVLAVLIGEDWAAERFGAPRPIIPRQRRDGSPMFRAAAPGTDEGSSDARWRPVAFVVAESVDLAKDASGADRRRLRAASLRHRDRRGAFTRRAEALGGMPRQRVLLLHARRQACRERRRSSAQAAAHHRRRVSPLQRSTRDDERLRECATSNGTLVAEREEEALVVAAFRQSFGAAGKSASSVAVTEGSGS